MNQEYKIGQRWVANGNLVERYHLMVREITRIEKESLNDLVLDVLKNEYCSLTKSIHIGSSEILDTFNFENTNKLLRGQDRVIIYEAYFIFRKS